jgi:hypothetical protein
MPKVLYAKLLVFLKTICSTIHLGKIFRPYLAEKTAKYVIFAQLRWSEIEPEGNGKLRLFDTAETDYWFTPWSHSCKLSDIC